MSLESMPGCTLIDRFSFLEKMLMRAGWYGAMAVGFYGIYKQDPLWAVLYAAFGILGFALGVMPSLCAHCPYPAFHSTCLFMPPAVVRKFYPYRGARMSRLEKVVTLVCLAGTMIIPLFWLARDRVLLVVFLLIGLPVLAVFPLHYCRRCRHVGCPLNRTSVRSAVPE